MERYEKETTLGEGAFGIVFLAKDKVTEEKVAIKRFKRGKYNDGVNFTALREIKLQQELQHPNITALLDVFIDEDTVNLVFELLPTSLDDIIKCKEIVLHPADIKSFLYMILQATAFCHEHTILHRDLKPENLLLSPKTYILKLADFGLGKVYGTPNRNMTSTVCTIWYRAPELLYGAREYSYAVDMWAIGCILGEMILRIPLFAGMNDLDQLGKIFHLLGTPTEEQWPEMSTLPNYIEFSAHSGIALSAVFGKSTTEDTLDLLSKLHYLQSLKSFLVSPSK